jgi:predicted small lipoprotein YifL
LNFPQTVILIVKSNPDLTRACKALLAVALTGLLAACGQKGPLYLPSIPPAPTASTQKPPVQESGKSNTPDSRNLTPADNTAPASQ